MTRYTNGATLSFQGRLKRAMARGNLSMADLARLFDRRHSTIRGWVVDGREPAGTPADVRRLFTLLVRLEQDILKGRLAGLSRPARAAHAVRIGEQG